METSILATILAAIAIVAQCRSLIPANVRNAESAACVDAGRSARVHRDASQDISSSAGIKSTFSHDSSYLSDEKTSLNTPEQLTSDLIVPYDENFAKLIEKSASENQNYSQQEIQLLTQIGLFIEKLIKEQLKVRNMYAVFGNVTDSTSQSLSNKSTSGSVNNLNDLDTVKEFDIVHRDGEMTDEFTNSNHAKRLYLNASKDTTFTTFEKVGLNNILKDLRYELMQIRKYFRILCNKRHSATTSEIKFDDDTFINQPNKISIDQKEHTIE